MRRLGEKTNAQEARYSQPLPINSTYIMSDTVTDDGGVIADVREDRNQPLKPNLKS